MVIILMTLAKLATLGLRKIKVFWNKVYDVIISVHDVSNKILSHYSNYIVDVVMWPKFGNCSISIREVKFYINVAKGLKVKVRKFLGLIPKCYVCGSYRGKTW